MRRYSRKIRVFGLVTMLLNSILVSNPASASQAILEQFFAEVNTLQADFEQRVTDETGQLLEYTKGRFSLSRPGKFRWDYTSTDAELPLGQQIVANGKVIYMFDPDLEQVTRRNLKDALGQVPSLLLVQSGSNIQEHFTVTDIGMTDGLSWVGLAPIDEDAGYQHLMMGFLNKTLNTIVLLDGLGNETRLVLSKVDNNLELPDELFEFNVPEGADLLVE